MVQFHPSPLRPLRHADGNLASDGRWSYTWDAENRLVQMLMADGFATLGMDVLKIEFDYDYLGRRVQKRVYKKAIQGQGGGALGMQDGGSAAMTTLDLEGFLPPPPSSWGLVTSRQYVWDGWLCIAEIVEREELRRSHTWGIDLSGSQQGAGGVGGLLFLVNANDIPQQVYQCFYDGNGNLVSLRDDSQAIAAQYDYGPFGELLTARGDYAAENPYRFSTKYVDAETGLYYYGYRYYNSSTGRWLSRDPIGEEGGLNLYGFVGNAPIVLLDALGLDWFDNVSDFTAGVADALSFGLTRLVRKSLNKMLYDSFDDNSVNPDGGYYKAGEYTEVAVEIAVTGGGASLRHIAKHAARESLEGGARKAYRKKIAQQTGGFVHHLNPIKGHPAMAGVSGGNRMARYPLPFKRAARGFWNMRWVPDRAAHNALHLHMMRLEAIDRVREATLLIRQAVNRIALYAERQGCPVSVTARARTSGSVFIFDPGPTMTGRLSAFVAAQHEEYEMYNCHTPAQ